ncbi:transcriptional coactivator p15/PC4 family protein [Methylobacterium sp. Leaf108]|uniref:transcriptional coactivator p15/PC4 family protein n=1 Tax=Methylobacterium sp. Leaf108 TaxID=1736256 RepID=UPI0006FBC20A|nr:transcriptional coactivator p15/PC4 family protein [Methylobacterium sp. Leaf108]KQP50555.1 hypothetical protein ASF39_12785 [Methylobacterium sp. Leaf108]
MDETRIAVIPENTREDLIVRLCEMHGKPMVNLRVFAANANGDLVPTKKGIAVRPELLDEVIKALQAAMVSAKAGGLLL